MLKVIIIVLLVGVVASLFSGLVFLFRDSEQRDSRRTLYALGLRIALATALLLTVFYGLYTGELRFGANAPWHGHERHGHEAHDHETPDQERPDEERNAAEDAAPD